MKCFNPFCDLRDKNFQSERGLICHILNNKKCSYHMMFYEDQNNKLRNQNRYNLFNCESATNLESNPKKRLCTNDDNLNKQFLNYTLNHNNFMLPEMQLLYNNSDFESDMENDSNDETYLIGPSSVSSDDEYIDDAIENKEVLGNIFTIEQRCMINLIKLLEDMQCPDTAVTKIID